MVTSDLLKEKAFRKTGYDVIISVHDIANKILSRDSNYNVNVVMWPKFGNSIISVREVIITSILWGFDQKNCFFEEWSCFKINNLGLALGATLKFYTRVAKVLKVLKLKVRKFWGLIPTFAEVTEAKLVEGGGDFLPILNKINRIFWCMVSEAFCKSVRTIPVKNPASTLVRILTVIYDCYLYRTLWSDIP